MEHILRHFRGGICLYCKKPVEKASWNSHWEEDDEHHYKKVRCDACGKKNWFKVDFHGSGHDAGLEEKYSLESMVRKVVEKY
jgi:DNA-directed RNA polymerase subunit RPC12/RpoP